MKYAILGATGQLGHDLCHRLAGDILAYTRADIDLERPETLMRLRQSRPDVVINCAAYNFVDRAETDPETAFRVNALGVRSLAEMCRDLGCRFVHYSSDYVFGRDTTRRHPYHTTDAPGPLSVYGASKLTGEYFVQAICPNSLVIRTCGLYGLHGCGGKGSNFVETMFRLAERQSTIRVVHDQRCTPTFTEDVADATRQFLEDGRTGLIHITNADDCTWFELARTIFNIAQKNINVVPITSEGFGAVARRPAYSVLRNDSSEMRPWQDALRAYLKKRTANRGRDTTPAQAA